MPNKFTCGIFNTVKDFTTVPPTDSGVRIFIKGFSDEATFAGDFNGGAKLIHGLFEGERVVMAWDLITEKLVHLKRVTINKNSKIIVDNYISKYGTVEDIPDFNPTDFN